MKRGATLILVERILSSILRAVGSVPSLSMRRAALDRALFEEMPPSESAPLVEAMFEAAARGCAAARTGCEVLAAAVANRRAERDMSAIEACRGAAAALGLPFAELVSGDEPPRRALAPRGKPPEVAISADVSFPAAPPFADPGLSGARRYVARGVGATSAGWQRIDELTRHTDRALLGRLFRARWLPLDAVVAAASRRPSTPILGVELARSDRWFVDPSVRLALAMNPFAPTWLRAALLPTLPWLEVRRVRDARVGDRLSDLASRVLAARAG